MTRLSERPGRPQGRRTTQDTTPAPNARLRGAQRRERGFRAPAVCRLAAVCAVAALVVSTWTLPAAAGWRRQTCRFSHGDGYSDTEVVQTIRCGVRRWAVVGGSAKALAVARCESGLDEHAYANGNAGVFQQRVVYWPARWRSYHAAVGLRLEVRRSVFNARANVLVSIRYAHLYGWGAWACA